MPKYFTLLFLFPIFSFGQKKNISGFLSFEKLPIEGIFIQAVNADNNNIIAFDKTTKDGAFFLNFDSISKGIRLTIYQIGFKKIDSLVFINNDSLLISFNLVKDNNLLPEINVKSKRDIVINGDTTSYNVSLFKKNEKTLEELLKKLPGIEVNSNGIIKFKNKPIKTILIDGDNIVQNDYKILSKNLTPDMVDKIQAIENYSDNELLTGIVSGKETVLNLVVNKNFKGFVHNKTEALGTFKDSLHQIKNLTISLLKEKKIINVFDKNNVGKYSIANSFEKNDNGTKDIGYSFLDNSYINNLTEENISKFNNSLYNNFNLFTKKKGKFEYSLHHNYFNDKQKYISNNITTFLNTNPTFTFVESQTSAIQAKNHNIKFNTKIITSKLSFLVGTIEYNRFNSTQFKNAINSIANQENSNSDKINLKDYSLYYIRKINLKNALEIETLYKEKSNLQVLNITPGVYATFFKNTYNSILQANYYTEQKNSNEIRWSGYNSWSKYVFNLGGLYKISQYGSTINLLSNTNILTADSLKNAEKIANKNLYISSKIDKDLTYKTNLKIENNLSVENISNELIKKNKLFYRTTISLMSNIGKYGNVDFTFNKSSNFIDANYYLKNYFFSKNNILIRNYVNDFATENKQEYKISFNSVNFFKYQQIKIFSMSYINKQNPIIQASENLNDLSIQKSQLIKKRLQNQSWVGYLLLSKKLPKIKNRINFSVQFLKLIYKMQQVNSDLSDNKSNIVNANVDLLSNFNGFFNYEFKFGINYNENNVFTNDTKFVFNNNTFNVNLKLITVVNKSLTGKFNISYIKNTTSAINLETNIDYNLPKNKFLISIGGQNLSNTNNLTRFFSNEFYVQENKVIIFPRFLYLKLAYNFSFRM